MILASTFERVQIIPGAIHNYVRISCVDCSTDTGKIAAAYENQVCIFEPTPLIHNTSPHVSNLPLYQVFVPICHLFSISLSTLTGVKKTNALIKMKLNYFLFIDNTSWKYEMKSHLLILFINVKLLISYCYPAVIRPRKIPSKTLFVPIWMSSSSSQNKLSQSSSIFHQTIFFQSVVACRFSYS